MFSLRFKRYSAQHRYILLKIVNIMSKKGRKKNQTSEENTSNKNKNVTFEKGCGQ